MLAVAAAIMAVAGSQHSALLRNTGLQQVAQLLTSAAAGPLQSVLQLLIWACLASAAFCTTLQLLPGCFSLGEAALMAQSAACLTASTAGALQHAAVFVPAVVCAQLPHGVLAPVQRLSCCTAAARSTALSLELLPAIISLTVAAAVAACLLLWVLLACTRQLRQLMHTNRVSNGPAAKSAQQQHPLSNGSSSVDSHRCDTAAGGTPENKSAGLLRCNGASHQSPSNGSHHSSRQHFPHRVVTLTALAATGCAAAAGICVVLLWLCCAAVWTLSDFMPARAGRLGVLLYWVVLLSLTLPVLKWCAHAGSMPQVGAGHHVAYSHPAQLKWLLCPQCLRRGAQWNGCQIASLTLHTNLLCL